MRKLIMASTLLIGLTAPLAAAAPAKPIAAPVAAPTGSPISKDVQCFILFVSVAGNAKDDATSRPASIGMSYYLGKITRGAPSLNLIESVKQESKVLQSSDPQKIGAACEQEFNKRMTDVDALGKALSAGK